MWKQALAMLMLTFCAGAQAATRVTVARVAAEGATFEEVALSFEASTQATSTDVAPQAPSLELRIARSDLATVGYVLENLRFRCALSVDDAGHAGCVGAVEARIDGERRRGRLALSFDDDSYDAALSKAKARLAIAVPRLSEDPTARDASAQKRLADARDTQIVLDDVPLDWLASLVALALDDARALTGTLDANAALTPQGELAGRYALANAGFDTADGTMAAAGLGAEGEFRVFGTSRTLSAKLTGGEVLVAPAYVKLPAHAVAIEVGSSPDSIGIELDDPGALRLAATMRTSASGEILAVDVASQAVFPDAYARYAQPMLATMGLGELDTAGKASIAFGWKPDAKPTFALEADALTLTDRAGRFAFDTLAGAVAVGRPDLGTQTLAWKSASLYGLPIEAAKLVTRSTDAARIELAAPLELALLGGRARIDTFRAADTVEASLTLENLSVASLAERFEWPKFGGTLSGKIPAIRSEGERLVFEGGLELALFDGRVAVGALAMERPFGVAPSLAADVTLADLDLALVTEAFSFGRIEGRLDGRVDGLRLVDWSPIAFDLVLATDPEHDGKRRISQRAVNSLSSVGGAGAVAGLQASVMRVFDSFPYAAIGLRCRLANNVCTMGGLEDSGDSPGKPYTIVRGSGLPRLTVQGYERRVDWPVLVERLEVATSGTGPVVE